MAKTRVSTAPEPEEAPVDVVVEVAPGDDDGLSDVERARAAERAFKAANPNKVFYREAGTSGSIGGERFNVGA